jgi:hypothetical protein
MVNKGRFSTKFVGICQNRVNFATVYAGRGCWVGCDPSGGLGAVKETLRCWAARRGEGFFRSGETNHGNTDGSIKVLPASAGG